MLSKQINRLENLLTRKLKLHLNGFIISLANIPCNVQTAYAKSACVCMRAVCCVYARVCVVSLSQPNSRDLDYPAMFPTWDKKNVKEKNKYFFARTYIKQYYWEILLSLSYQVW